MFIKRIATDNYRSLFKFSVDLQSLTILVGRNDAGKSNLLRAIQLLLDPSVTETVDRYDWSRLARRTRYPKEIIISGEFLDLSIRRKIYIQKEGVASSVLEINRGDGWVTPNEDEFNRLPAFYYLKPRTGSLQEAFDPKKENNIFSLVKEWMPPALAQEKYLHKLMRGYSPKDTNLAAYVKFIENEVYGPLGIGFPGDSPYRALNVDFRTPMDRGRLFVRELTHSKAKKALFRLPLDHHGTGLISVVAMVLTIAVLQEHHRQNLNHKPLIIGIEEPEVHLHPQAQRTLLDYFKMISSKVQLVITTHAPIFIDRSQPENVLVLRRHALMVKKGSKGSIAPGSTQTIRCDYRNNWKAAISELGIRLSDAIMSGDVNLLVEGPTEAILFPAMAEQMSQEGILNFDFTRVFVVSGEGGNMPHLAKILTSNGNPTIVVVDNDYGGNKIKDKLSKVDETLQLPSPKSLSAPLNRLKKVEFEDMLSPRGLLEAFNKAFFDVPAYDFLPLSFAEFERTRDRLIGQGLDFGWVATMNALIEEKASPNSELIFSKDKFNKRILAEKAAELIRDGSLPVPNSCKSIILTVSEYI